MCTANTQKYLPNSLTDTTGHENVTDGKPQPIRRATEVPLGDDSMDASKQSILMRRERMKRAAEDSGSMKPTLRRTRQNMMDELT